MTGYVYLVGCEGGFFKIGQTKSPQRRVSGLQGACPLTLSLLHVIPCHDSGWLEFQLHEFFSAKVVRPRSEWFLLSEEDVRRLMAVGEIRSADDVPDWLTLTGVPLGRVGLHDFLWRAPDDLWEQLEASAERHGRSLTKELEMMVRKCLETGDGWQLGLETPPPPKRPRGRPRKEK